MTKLKEFRTARGISQENLAGLIGVSRQTISKWENGIVQPSADSLMSLSQVFQLPLEAFLKDDWTPPEQQAVESVAILPETSQDTDAKPAVTASDAPPESVAEIPPHHHRNYRLWGTLAAVIAVVGIIAGVIFFSGRVDNVSPISGIERKEVDGFQIEFVTRQPLQP